MSKSKSPTISVQRSDGEAYTRVSQTNGNILNGKGPSMNGTTRSLTGRASDMSMSINSSYSFDVQKYLKELIKKREEIPAARVLPKTHLLAQLILAEVSERELFTVQEKSLRQQIMHKRDEDRSKKEEQKVQQRSREKMEELKKKQSEEMAVKKESVVLFQKQIDGEIKSKLRIVSLLQPRLNVAGAALAEIKNESSLLRILPELIEEEKRLVKALKADSRTIRNNNNNNNNDAIPNWMRTCVAGSLNVSAILNDSPLRATVEDAIKVPNAALRKLVVVRNTAVDDDNNNNNNNKKVVAWVHVRAGADPIKLASELAQLPAPDEFPGKISAGVVWPKEDLAELNKKSKAAATETDLMSVVGVSASTLSCEGLSSFEFTKKDIENIGTLASA